MERVGDVIEVQPFVALTTAIVVLFVGKWLNQRFAALDRLCISESVSGGLLIAIVIAAIYFVLQVEIRFDLAARPFVAVYFFTAIGINMKLSAILAARRTLVVLLIASVAYMALQDLIAVAIGRGLGGGPEVLLAGTVALVGGYDTVLAWVPKFVGDFGVVDAQEIGIASATFGLVAGALAGGPIASRLIRRHGLRPAATEEVEAASVRQPALTQRHGMVDPYVVLRSILAIHICVIVGVSLKELIDTTGYAPPLPLACFVAAIILTNVVPMVFPRAEWPSRTSAMSLIAELSLGILFGMSLISAQLWVLADLPPALLTTLLIQAAVATAIIAVVIFRILGRDHDAAVMCAGFTGFALGSVATAMANMKAVARDSGTSHVAFIIVPLVTVFCVDAFNRPLIELFLSVF